jgi:hypothetical protein
MPEDSDTLKSIRRRWWLTVRLNSFYCLAGIDQSDWIPRLKAASDPAKEFLFLPERKPAEERSTGFPFFLPGQTFPARSKQVWGSKLLIYSRGFFSNRKSKFGDTV